MICALRTARPANWSGSDSSVPITPPMAPAISPTSAPFRGLDLQRTVLLAQVGGQRAAADHPQAAAAVADVDDRQRRQHADEHAAPERRLKPLVHVSALAAARPRSVSRSTRSPRWVISSSPFSHRSVFFSFIIWMNRSCSG